MRRFSSFLFGIVVGGALVFFGQRYHVLRTNNGLELIPKLSSGLAETYVDVRHFQASDWDRHKSLAAAVVQAKRESILTPSGAKATAPGAKSSATDPKRPRPA